MKNTLKDILNVSAIVNYLTDLQESRRYPNDNHQIGSITSTRSFLTEDLKKVLKQLAEDCHDSLQGKLKRESVYENFNQLSMRLERNLLKANYSTVSFLKYCCQVCVLASLAFYLGLKPAPRLAEFCILHTIKKFRTRVQFGNDNWRYMSFVVAKYLEDGGVLP